MSKGKNWEQKFKKNSENLKLTSIILDKKIVLLDLKDPKNSKEQYKR